MKQYLKKLTVFLIVPVIMLLLCDTLIPVTALVYRPWEAVVFSKFPSNSPFYPNTTIYMNSVGDLCHHSPNSNFKDEYWKTDELGFRNDKYIKDADVLIIGDSYIAGSGLTQENTITNQLNKLDCNLKVYNMAPSSISQFDKLLQKGMIIKPKYLIYSIVERDVPCKINQYTNSAKNIIVELFPYKDIIANIDQYFKFYSLNWIKARLTNTTGVGIKGVENSNMYFFQGANQKHEAMDLANTVNAIVDYKKYCDSLGISFIFLPMPDKESVYYEYVPFDVQPDYLFKLDSLLKIEGVSTINTLKIYNDYRKIYKNLLYHLDDTHWNSNAVELVSREILGILNQNQTKQVAMTKTICNTGFNK